SAIPRSKLTQPRRLLSVAFGGAEAAVGFIELLLLPLLFSAACAVALIVIGVRKRSAGRIAFGVVQLSIFGPLAVTFVPGGYQAAVALGEVLVVGLAVAFVIQWAVTRARAETLFGLIGVVAFGAHGFLLANAP